MAQVFIPWLFEMQSQYPGMMQIKKRKLIFEISNPTLVVPETLGSFWALSKNSISFGILTSLTGEVDDNNSQELWFWIAYRDPIEVKCSLPEFFASAARIVWALLYSIILLSTVLSGSVQAKSWIVQISIFHQPIKRQRRILNNVSWSRLAITEIFYYSYQISLSGYTQRRLRKVYSCSNTVYHWPNKREPDHQNCNVVPS